MKILVIGAGLSGLTTATILARQGYEVTVMADKIAVDSASIVATAIWHVYLVDPDDKRILDWSSRTLEVLVQLAETEAKSGVELIEGVELYRNSEEALPPWFSIPPKFSMLPLQVFSLSDEGESNGCDKWYRVALAREHCEFLRAIDQINRATSRYVSNSKI
ncbi:FAD dependent oxidoreductase [Aliiroseovarius crassostreae]|uniref:D-amino-acid oxidase n=1 Tax=Aliiroseovarius crassostreae TaxID=154981 RepID=A0A0P7JP43_9RHOB|nr:FAD-dependent oxidoreductase [Aliiroseovarius crassostreae]KPN63008.1 hypothetical protein AKJ29_02330 [Aliiroseovarius crassostreae]SFU68027.1 FAD dependent oxidoreductase [Aliiroseovarius crassostreae]